MAVQCFISPSSFNWGLIDPNLLSARPSTEKRKAQWSNEKHHTTMTSFIHDLPSGTVWEVGFSCFVYICILKTSFIIMAEILCRTWMSVWSHSNPAQLILWLIWRISECMHFKNIFGGCFFLKKNQPFIWISSPPVTFHRSCLFCLYLHCSGVMWHLRVAWLLKTARQEMVVQLLQPPLPISKSQCQCSLQKRNIWSTETKQIPADMGNVSGEFCILLGQFLF